MRRALIGSAVALLALQHASPVQAQPSAPRPRPAAVRPAVERFTAGPGSQTLSLETGNGRIISLPGPATNVFVADPKVAEVRPASTNSLFVFGVGPGRTTIAAMDAEGHAISQFDVSVRPNTFAASEAEATVARLVPNGRIRVVPQARGMMVTGTVNTPADAARAVAILKGYVAEGQLVENQLTVQASVQINLRVRIVEMQRNVTRALGIDWQSVGSVGRLATSFATGNGLGIAGSAAGVLRVGSRDVNAIIDALAADNLVRVLAEPNLTVMSGQPGSFLAGGEYPIPIAQKDNVITVDYKKYGVSLNVVPTVLSDGRINLHIAPEVSQLTDTGSIKISNSNNSNNSNSGFGSSSNLSLSVPSILVRRAETSVELGSGQSFALAGLLQDTTTQTTSGLTFLGDLPIIGALFRSSAFQRQETELVMVVTPYIVRPVDDPAQMRTPSDGFTVPNDLERILLLRQVGMPGNIAPTRIPGAAGFIVQ